MRAGALLLPLGWILVAELATCTSAPAPDAGPRDQVDALLDALVSPVPPPHPDQDRSAGSEPVPGRPGTFQITGLATGYEHPRVTEATRELIALGTGIYPRLVARLDDQRYSFSRVSAAWINYPVGTKVREILAVGIEFSGQGYKSRDCLRGIAMMPGFSGYLAEQDAAAWALQAAGSTKERLRRDYLAWAVAKEKACGFKNEEEERTYLAPYLEELRRMDRDSGPLDRADRRRDSRPAPSAAPPRVPAGVPSGE